MPYDAQSDTHTCPTGNTFISRYENVRRSKSGYASECFKGFVTR